MLMLLLSRLSPSNLLYPSCKFYLYSYFLPLRHASIIGIAYRILITLLEIQEYAYNLTITSHSPLTAYSTSTQNSTCETLQSDI